MWLTHKFTCSKPKSSFTLPTLSLREMMALIVFYDVELLDGASRDAKPRTLLQIVHDLGLFEGNYKGEFDALSLSASSCRAHVGAI